MTVPPGKVYLVGAGPGDPELLTLKARRLLTVAGAVVYDELVSAAILDFAPPACERIYAGKRARHHALPQAAIVALMIARARAGRAVVRLKGGDPFLFGRGGEEADALAAAGIAWEVVPGVSAGLAAPALAGIPLTHRELADGVVLRSGHRCQAARPGLRPTQVVFMGLGRLAAIAAEYAAAGWPAATPVAVIAEASLPAQRVVVGTLATIAADVAAANLPSPALIVMGEVVGCRDRWLAPTADTQPGPFLEPRAGLIVLAHGSPLASWHASLDRLCAELAASGEWVRPAYLPPAEPQLGDVVGAAIAAGLRRAVVVPYFLADGLHVTRDIPALVAAARARFPHLAVELAPSLDGHPALRTAVLARAALASDTSASGSRL